MLKKLFDEMNFDRGWKIIKEEPNGNFRTRKYKT